MVIVRIRALYLITIIKSEVWPNFHCLGSGHETMVCAACFLFHLYFHFIYICQKTCDIFFRGEYLFPKWHEEIEWFYFGFLWKKKPEELSQFSCSVCISHPIASYEKRLNFEEDGCSRPSTSKVLIMFKVTHDFLKLSLALKLFRAHFCKSEWRSRDATFRELTYQVFHKTG